MTAASYALAALAAASLAASSTASAHNFSGCTYRGVERGCLMVKSGGRVYNITSARPRPGVNRAIAGHGDVARGITICQQGTALKNIRWHYTKMACPKPGRRRG